MILDSRYEEYFPEYAKYSGIPLMLNESMYVMPNSGKLFGDELTKFLINESGLNQYNFQMYVYYKCSPDGLNLVVLSYVYDCV